MIALIAAVMLAGLIVTELINNPAFGTTVHNAALKLFGGYDQVTT
jgi:hypothetical protein